MECDIVMSFPGPYLPDVLLCVLCRFGTGCSRHFFRIDSESRYDDHFFIDIVGVGDDDAVFTGRGISESQVIGVFSVFLCGKGQVLHIVGCDVERTYGRDDCRALFSVVLHGEYPYDRHRVGFVVYGADNQIDRFVGCEAYVGLTTCDENFSFRLIDGQTCYIHSGSGAHFDIVFFQFFRRAVRMNRQYFANEIGFGNLGGDTGCQYQGEQREKNFCLGFIFCSETFLGKSGCIPGRMSFRCKYK